jgi:hypothetical protein
MVNNLSTSDTSESQSVLAEQTLNTEIQPNSFATINTTFSDTGTVTQTSEPSFLKPYAPLPDQSPTDMLSRMVDVLPFNWAIADPVSLTVPKFNFDVFNILCSDPFLASVLNKFYYFRADVEIHFRLNTNSFYGGALMITTFPGEANTAIENFVQARSWRPKMVLSAQKQDTVIITMPWYQPERFLTVNDILIGGVVPWKVNVDILAPLVCSSPSAPDNVNVNVSLRFVNAKVVWPIHVASPRVPTYRAVDVPRPRYRTEKFTGNAALQSGKSQGFMTTKMKNPGMPRTTALLSKTVGGPAQSAVSSVNSTAREVESTVSDGISTVLSPITGVIQGLQPLLGIGAELGGLLSMFDKPNIPDKVTRIVQTTGANMATCDVPDQSLPLTLYTPSYLSVDQRTVPEGGPWSLARVACTPALHCAYEFKNSQPSAIVPFMALGTPFSVVAATHRFWRGSVRMRLMFFCPSFYSARVLLVFTPSAITSADIITNTLSRVVDIRGDTVEDFTLPYVNQTDFQKFGADIGVLQVSLYTEIICNDTTVDPVINMVVFSAAGPDCQFYSPIPTQDVGYDYPNLVTSDQPSRRRKPLHVAQFQSDVDKAFTETMLPFVKDCQYMTDECFVAPETTSLVTDIMKRYTTVPIYSTNTVGVLFRHGYFPAAGSCAATYARMFNYWRGGFRLKLAVQQAGFSQLNSVYIDDGNSTKYNLGGTAGFVTGSVEGGMDVSVPWTEVVPFYDINTYSTTLTCVNNYTSPDTTNYFYTAIGDDFVIGMLVPPDNLPDNPAPPQVRVRNQPKRLLPLRYGKRAGS